MWQWVLVMDPTLSQAPGPHPSKYRVMAPDPELVALLETHPHFSMTLIEPNELQ